MSLVSCIGNYGMTILVGDLTISDKVGENLIIPTINRIPADFNQDHIKPVSFQKKLFIVKDKLAIGCTGSVIGIKDLIYYTKDFFLHREVDEQNLIYLLNEVSKNADYQQVSAIFLLIRSEKPPYNIGVGKLGSWKIFDTSFIGSIFSSGSGADEWTNHLIETLPYYNLVQDNTINVRSTIDVVLMNSMYFIEQNIIGPDNFRDGWGLPIDIIYAEGIFKRIEKVCYITWEVDTSIENWWIIPKTIIKVTNQEDDLYIHNYNGQFRLYIITSIGNKNQNQTIPNNLDFSAEIICSSIDVFFDGEFVTKLQLVYNNTGAGEVIMAKMIDDRLSFLFREDFTKVLRSSVMEFQQ